MSDERKCECGEPECSCLKQLRCGCRSWEFDGCVICGKCNACCTCAECRHCGGGGKVAGENPTQPPPAPEPAH